MLHEIYWGTINIGCLLPAVSSGGNGAFDGATRLLVALTFGMGILVLAYAAGHHSGGQINCAVTLSLVLGGQVPWFQGVVSSFCIRGLLHSLFFVQSSILHRH